MEPTTELDAQLHALALARASVMEDQTAIAALMTDPPSVCMVVSLAALAATALERAYGKSGALTQIDGWVGLTLKAAAPAEKNPRARGDVF